MVIRGRTSNCQKTDRFKSIIKGFDSVWIELFIKHAAVAAGSGLSKSLMLKD